MTTRFPGGVTTVKAEKTLGDFIMPDPTTAHVYMEDFDYYTAGDWTVTTGGTGSTDATQALTDGDGGLLLLTNGTGDDGHIFMNKVGESFLLSSGKKAWLKARLKANGATQSDILIGLQITDTTPLDGTDGVFFLKADGSTAFGLLVEKDSTATTTAGVATMADDTYLTLGWYYDGVDKIKIFADDVHVATSVTTNIPDDTELTISFACQNGEATAKTMTIDYIMVAKER
jgi:hypothetical protein